MALVASTMRAEQTSASTTTTAGANAWNTTPEQTGGRQPTPASTGWTGGAAPTQSSTGGTILPLTGATTPQNAARGATAAGTTAQAPTRDFEPTAESFARPNTQLRTATSADIYNEVIDAEMPSERDPSQQETNTENVRQISFAGTGADFDPQVSRDGKSIIYASTQHRETADIYVQQVGSRVITRLTSDPGQDVMPAMSPNGEYVVFSSNRTGAWNLYMMPSTGGREVQLTNERTHDLHPSWSPDGRRLVFSRLGQTSGRWELWVMDITNPASLQFIGYGLFAEWSPVAGTGFQNADKIVFQRSRERGDRAFSIWTIDFNERSLTAGQETEIVSSTTEALINPSWSPDGDFVIYASVSRAGDERGQRQPSSLWMIGHDGRGKVKLIGGASADLMPTWAPDNTVYFVSDRSGVENLWAFEVAQAVKTANAQRPGAGSPTGRSTGPEFATAPTGNE
jgi:TolB protein